MNGRTETLTPEQVADFNKQIATEWKLCRDVRDTNKSSQSVDNENESEDGFFIEIYDPKGLVSKEKRS